MSNPDVGAIKKAQEKVLGESRDPITKSGEEPPSGYQGAGTVDQPYDQGNQPEQPINQNEEPLSGKKGEGTVDKPYDQGNQPEQEPKSTMSIVDQLSRTKTKEEIAQNKKRRESRALEQTTSNGAATTPSISSPAPVPTQTQEPDRGRDNTASVTAASAPKDVDTKKLAPKQRPQFERSMSPGQLDDGSHVQCSGERGEAYTPPSGLGKIAGKLGIGRH